MPSHDTAAELQHHARLVFERALDRSELSRDPVYRMQALFTEQALKVLCESLITSGYSLGAATEVEQSRRDSNPAVSREDIERRRST